MLDLRFSIDNEEFTLCLETPSFVWSKKKKIHSVPSDALSASFSTRIVKNYLCQIISHTRQQTYRYTCIFDSAQYKHPNRQNFKFLRLDQRDPNAPQHSIQDSIRHQTIFAPTATNVTSLHLVLITSSNIIQQIDTNAISIE